MKKKLAIVIVFVIVLVFPMVTWPIVSQFDLPTVDENREKAKFPEFGNDVFTQFDKYFADRAPYRDLLIKLYKGVELSLAKVYQKMQPNDDYSDSYTAIDKVILGQNDWLFYKGDDSLAYYKGTNLPTERELRQYVARAEKVNEYFKAQGKQFVIYIAPNKEQIYSEYVPEGIHVVNEIKRLDLIYNYFKKHSDVTVIYPKEQLLAAKEICPTYMQQDTHWNDFGAYVGSKVFFEALQIDVGDVQVTDVAWSGGDLSRMAVIDGAPYTVYKVNYRPEVTLDYRLTTAEKYEFESSNKNGKNLLVIGDSFVIADYSATGNYREGMKEIIAKEFENTNVYHRDTFTVENNYSSQFNAATTVMFEAVERYETSIFESFGVLQRFIDIYGL